MKQAIHKADTATDIAAPRMRFGKISAIMVELGLRNALATVVEGEAEGKPAGI